MATYKAWLTENSLCLILHINFSFFHLLVLLRKTTLKDIIIVTKQGIKVKQLQMEEQNTAKIVLNKILHFLFNLSELKKN